MTPETNVIGIGVNKQWKVPRKTKTLPNSKIPNISHLGNPLYIWRDLRKHSNWSEIGPREAHDIGMALSQMTIHSNQRDRRDLSHGPAPSHYRTSGERCGVWGVPFVCNDPPTDKQRPHWIIKVNDPASGWQWIPW